MALGRRWVPTATRRWQFESSAAGTICADPERVAAALDALIENAVKFTDETDDIEVRAEPAGDVRFVVADTGAGISRISYRECSTPSPGPISDVTSTPAARGSDWQS